MKKILSVAAVALALSATAVQANEGVYVGGNFQMNSTSIKGDGGSDKVDSNLLNLTAGYDFNEYFAAEVRVGLGMSSESATIAQAVSYEHKPKTSYGVYGVGKLPINEMFSLYALVGYGSSPLNAQIKASGKTVIDETVKIGGIQYAAGMQFNVTPAIAITAEYGVFGTEKVKVAELNDELKFETTGFNLGMKYKF
ncbi:porin family protein [Photobacterium sanguinicancri]|uniref:porin family protein n=1 Tax=Photobacterium sanguinicancri TaxID=875932 RepID=UPI003D141861